MAQNPAYVELTAVLSVVLQIAQIAAILLAGLWAYYQYFRGRTFRSRLEPHVSGELFHRAQTDYVIATLVLKNVGLSKVNFQEVGSGLRISTYGEPTTAFADIPWVSGGVFPIFPNDKWIEPGELLQGKIMSQIPKGQVAVRLELRIVSGDLEWNAADVVGVSVPGRPNVVLAGEDA